ncbi:M56 family metallopeptidase [Solilutibacter silvestris]|uniref:M56 family metallopeptidase n=1 Tax=Solilutibacter silvestris TaxID=1645665 RepID=UPI003D32ECC3
MTDLVSADAIAALVPLLAATLLHFLWQGALIGALAWMSLLALRSARPQARYAVACLALLACLIAPVLTFAKLYVASISTSTPAISFAFAAAGSADPVQAGIPLLASLPSPTHPMFAWIVAAWATGTTVFALRMASGLWWVRRLRTRAACADARRWQACADAFAQGFGIRRRVTVRMIEEGDSPLSVGWWKPMVLLPAAIAANMPVPLLEALVAHELAHIRRHDYLVNLLQGAIEALLFYHPVVWWLSRRIRIERELVADDLAAGQLGDPRRLALALSELDRMNIARSPLPNFVPAQAAHGGQLMSRIKQLLRPERRTVGSAVLVPVVGIVALGIAVQAYAKFDTHAQPQESGSVAASAPAPSPAPKVAPVAVTTKKIATARDNTRDGYALVHKRDGKLTLTGNSVDSRDIDDTTRGIAGDFIWFRKDGKAYVVRDAATLARVEQAWAALEPQQAKIRDLQAQMAPHQQEIEALGKRMDGMQVKVAQTPEARDEELKMQKLAEEQRELAEQQRKLAMQQVQASDAQRDALNRQMQQLSMQQDALSKQMERHSVALQAQQSGMQAESAKMDAIAREMDAAAKPMDAIGKQMDAVGKEMEQKARIIDKQVRALIDEAVQNGLAQPAPSRQ